MHCITGPEHRQNVWDAKGAFKEPIYNKEVQKLIRIRSAIHPLTNCHSLSGQMHTCAYKFKHCTSQRESTAKALSFSWHNFIKAPLIPSVSSPASLHFIFPCLPFIALRADHTPQPLMEAAGPELWRLTARREVAVHCPVFYGPGVFGPLIYRRWFACALLMKRKRASRPVEAHWLTFWPEGPLGSRFRNREGENSSQETFEGESLFYVPYILLTTLVSCAEIQSSNLFSSQSAKWLWAVSSKISFVIYRARCIRLYEKFCYIFWNKQ